VQTKSDTKPPNRKRGEHLSKDGNWRSFPRVPHQLQYVNNGINYARVKVRGKLIRQSLETGVWSTGQLRLVDFLKEQRESAAHTPVPTFAESVKVFKRELEHDTSLKASSRGYRLLCLQKIDRTWPGLGPLGLDVITARACKEWAARLNKEIAPQYFNNVIGTLRLVIDAGIMSHKLAGGGLDTTDGCPQALIRFVVVAWGISVYCRASLVSISTRLQPGDWSAKGGKRFQPFPGTGKLNDQLAIETAPVSPASPIPGRSPVLIGGCK
jgi:hypothetical protein